MSGESADTGLVLVDDKPPLFSNYLNIRFNEGNCDSSKEVALYSLDNLSGCKIISRSFSSYHK